MIRLTVQLLIVSLLTLNIAWAVDKCAFTDPGQVNGVLLPVDDQFPDSPNAGLDCDDWCHAWVSPVALTRNSVPDVFIPAATISGGGTCILSYASLPIPPPYHPPIA